MAFFDKDKIKRNVERDEEKYYVGQDIQEQTDEKLEKRVKKARRWKIALGILAGVATIAFPWAFALATTAPILTTVGIAIGAVALALDAAFVGALVYGYRKPLNVGKTAKILDKSPEKLTKKELHPQNIREYINMASRGVSQDKLDDAEEEVKSEKQREFVKFDKEIKGELVTKFREDFDHLTDEEKEKLAKAMRPNEEKIIKARNGNVTRLSYPYTYKTITINGEPTKLSSDVKAHTVEGHLIYEQQLASLGADIVLEFDLRGIKGKRQKADLGKDDKKAEEKRTKTLATLRAFEK